MSISPTNPTEADLALARKVAAEFGGNGLSMNQSIERAAQLLHAEYRELRERLSAAEAHRTQSQAALLDALKQVEFTHEQVKKLHAVVDDIRAAIRA